MNLLAGTYYDPAVAVSEATSSLLAMTALDTTNLRLTFTAPPSGRVKVIISGGFNGTALATTQLPVRVEYIQTGLTPGQQYVWDAAYSVEILLASTAWKYGGPNNTTTNDAFGGISFEIWDPSPVYTAGSGIPPTTPISARVDTIDDLLDTEITDIRNRLPAALVSGRMDCSVGAMAADTLTAAALAADAGTEIGTAVWGSATRVLTAGTNIALAKGTGVTGFNDLSAAQVNAEVDTAIADAALATAANLATVASYLDTEIAAILADTNELQTDWADGGRLDSILDARASQASVDDLPTNAELATALAAADDAVLAAIADLPTNAELATALGTADDAVIAAIGALHNFDPATDEVLANIKKVNDVTVSGDGQPGTEWGPA